MMGRSSRNQSLPEGTIFMLKEQMGFCKLPVDVLKANDQSEKKEGGETLRELFEKLPNISPTQFPALSEMFQSNKWAIPAVDFKQRTALVLPKIYEEADKKSNY